MINYDNLPSEAQMPTVPNLKAGGDKSVISGAVIRLMRGLHQDTITNPTPNSDIESATDAVTALRLVEAEVANKGQTGFGDFIRNAPGTDAAYLGRMINILKEHPSPSPEKTPQFDEQKGLVMRDNDAFERHKQYLIALLNATSITDQRMLRQNLAKWNGEQLLRAFPSDEQPSHIITISAVESLSRQLTERGIATDDAIDNVAIIAHRGRVDVRMVAPQAEPQLDQPGAELEQTDVAPVESLPVEPRAELEQAADKTQTAEVAEVDMEPVNKPQDARDRRSYNVAITTLAPLIKQELNPDQIRDLLEHANGYLQAGSFWSVDEVIRRKLLPQSILNKAALASPKKATTA